MYTSPHSTFRRGFPASIHMMYYPMYNAASGFLAYRSWSVGTYSHGHLYFIVVALTCLNASHSYCTAK